MSTTTRPDYEYDIFLSYRRAPPVKPWVTQTFLPLLCNWLSVTPGALRSNVFFDRLSVPWGADWRNHIVRCLRRSKLLLAICSPDYFDSHWCRYEWDTFRLRHKFARTSGLLLAVRFNDGHGFPKDAKRIQMEDLSRWTLTAPGFRHSAEYVDFENTVKNKLAPRIADALGRTPAFDPKFPIPDVRRLRKANTVTIRNNQLFEEHALDGIANTNLWGV